MEEGKIIIRSKLEKSSIMWYLKQATMKKLD